MSKISLLSHGYVLATYKVLRSVNFTSKDNGIQIVARPQDTTFETLVNASNSTITQHVGKICCYAYEYPHLFTYHLDGMIQVDSCIKEKVYDIESNQVNKSLDSESNLKMLPKMMLLNSKKLVIVYSNKFRVWNRISNEKIVPGLSVTMTIQVESEVEFFFRVQVEARILLLGRHLLDSRLEEENRSVRR